ncbi:MAG TPA: hypothetical protein VLJ59_00460 [Mycobacteriales bacterium]|nr:hypothetical protein [Mycobacteriales bacterium]
MTWRNADADWDRWPVEVYLAENYREVHACDAAVIAHHSAFYRRLAPGSVARSLEFGAGPNLYPLMLATAASRRIDAVDRSAANVAYLRRQRHHPDESWQPFYARCRELNAGLPPTLLKALARVRVRRGDLRDVPAGGYQLASMHFVAESISDDLAEVAMFCRAFAGAVGPGGYLVAAFMENMARYTLGDGSQWPGCPVVGTEIHDILAPYTDELVIDRIDADPTLPAYGYTGMILLTARRPT